MKEGNRGLLHIYKEEPGTQLIGHVLLRCLFLSSYKLVDNELFNERRIRKKRKEKNQHLSFFSYPEYLVKVTHLLIPIVTKPKKESTMFTNGYTTSMVPYDGTSMELSRRSDPGEFNLLLLINFVAIASTFFTCSASTLAPIVALSCAFNIISAVVSLLLGILSGVDLLNSREPRILSAEEFMDKVKWAPHTRAILDGLFAKVGNVRTISNLLQSLEYEELNDSKRCLSMSLDNFQLHGMEGSTERVCVSQEGSHWLQTMDHTSREKASVTRRLRGLRQNKIVRYGTKVDQKFLGLFGHLTDRAVDGLEEIYERHKGSDWVNGSIDYTLRSDGGEALVEMSLLNKHTM